MEGGYGCHGDGRIATAGMAKKSLITAMLAKQCNFIQQFTTKLIEPYTTLLSNAIQYSSLLNI